jgi:hypothetical protein
MCQTCNWLVQVARETPQPVWIRRVRPAVPREDAGCVVCGGRAEVADFRYGYSGDDAVWNDQASFPVCGGHDLSRLTAGQWADAVSWSARVIADM